MDEWYVQSWGRVVVVAVLHRLTRLYRYYLSGLFSSCNVGHLVAKFVALQAKPLKVYKTPVLR